jgi:hypothetical protein
VFEQILNLLFGIIINPGKVEKKEKKKRKNYQNEDQY